MTNKEFAEELQRRLQVFALDISGMLPASRVESVLREANELLALFTSIGAKVG